jgi:type IV pilus assembly protein PilM
MIGRVAGLDIGTSAVRAVELNLDSERPTMTAFGQVSLPRGAVVDGEIVDAAVVTEAIRRLWARGRFSVKQVRLGVSSQRVIVRQADLPAMTEAELRSAIHFEAQELIPIPIDEALLDFCILGPPPVLPGDDSAEDARMKVLLVAAPREMVLEHVNSVQAAGLVVDAVDAVPLALFRAVPVFGTGSTGAEAIVSVGAGLTTVVVREAGVPRFMRVLNRGTEDITSGIAQSLGVELDVAEDFKRRSAGAGDVATAVRARTLIHDGLLPLVEDIRGSLDFYLAQSDAEHIDRVILTGGGVRTPGLPERLAHVVNTDVEVADPLRWLKAGKTGLTQEELAEAAPLLVTPVGLALAGSSGALGGYQVSLLPVEILERRRQKKQATTAAMIAAAVAALLGLGWGWRAHQISSASQAANHAEAGVGLLQARVAAVNNTSGAKAQLRAQETTAVGILQTDVDWVRVIEQVTAELPPDVYLSSFAGTSNAAASGSSSTSSSSSASSTAGGSPVVGSVTFAAVGSSQESVSAWLRQLAAIPALTNVWVANSAQGGTSSNSVTFTSSASLTDGAYSGRAAQVGK